MQQHVEFEGSAQTVDIYNSSSSREPWRMQTKTQLTNTGGPFMLIIVGKNYFTEHLPLHFHNFNFPLIINKYFSNHSGTMLQI